MCGGLFVAVVGYNTGGTGLFKMLVPAAAPLHHLRIISCVCLVYMFMEEAKLKTKIRIFPVFSSACFFFSRGVFQISLQLFAQPDFFFHFSKNFFSRFT